jgi:hypothetical protein
LLELMLETGMRVGDAIRYDPPVAVKGKHLWIYTFVPQQKKKTDQPKPLESYLTERLKTAIDQCEWLSPNPRSIMARLGTKLIWRTKYTTGYKPSAKGAVSRIADPTAYVTHRRAQVAGRVSA